MGDVLVATHLMLGRGQRERLRALAADQQTSLAALVREAVSHYLALVAGPDPRKTRRAALEAAGMLPPPRRAGLGMPSPSGE